MRMVSPARPAVIDLAAPLVEAGLYCFLLNGKLPAVPRKDGGQGWKDATLDLAALEDMARRYPDANNVGVQPGMSGLVGVDLDETKPVEKVPGLIRLQQFAAERGGIPETLTVRTGSGGRHLWFRADPERELGQRNGILNPDTGLVESGVDYRGTKGYLVAPASLHPSTGKPYLWQTPSGHFEAGLVLPLPEWFARWLDPPRVSAPIPTDWKPTPLGSADQRRVAGLIAARCERLSHLGPGMSRRTELQRAAFQLAGWCWVGFPVTDLRHELRLAAEACGHWDRDTERTIDDAIKDGLARPVPLPPNAASWDPAPRMPRRSESPLVEEPPIDVYDSVPEARASQRSSSASEASPTQEGDEASSDIPPSSGSPNRDGTTSGERPVIVLGPRADCNVLASLDALATHRDIFVQGPTLVRVLKTTTGRLVHHLKPEALPPLLSARADFRRNARLPEGGFEERPVEPPLPMAKQIIAGGAFPGFRQLDGIVTSPILRSDGTLHAKAGYDDETRLYLAPVGEFPAPPEHPTQEHAPIAAERLLAPFAQFGFRDKADPAALVAMILSLVGKAAHEGPTPMFPVTANIRGSGKGKLATCAVLIATGSVPAVIGWPDTEAEQGKRLDTLILGGTPVALFDNITGVLGGAPLDLALTAWSYSGRVLGKSLMPRVDRVWTVFIATGNNCTFGGDAARRVVPIRLHCDTSRPEDRTFDIADLQAHVREHRATLYADAVTILRAFLLAGKPAHGKSLLGSFEGWDSLVRAAVIWAGLPDPLGTRAEIEQVDEAEQKHGQLISLLAVLFHNHTEPWTSGDVAVKVEALPESSASGGLTLREARDVLDGLGAWDRTANRLSNKALGQQLSHYADRPDAEKRRIVRAGMSRRKVSQWRIL